MKDITLPPFDDVDENGIYCGNDINFLIKNDTLKNDVIKKIKGFNKDDLKNLTKRLFKSEIYILNETEWKSLIKLFKDEHYIQLKNVYNFDTIEIGNYIFKKQSN